MLGQNWIIYSYPPSPPPSDKPISAIAKKVKENTEPPFPAFVHKALSRVAEKFSDRRIDDSSTYIDCKDFYLDVGYYEDTNNVRIYGFGLKDQDMHRQGLGKEILQYFFASLAIYSTIPLEITLYSVSTAIGFYLRCGMAIQALTDTHVDPVEVYYSKKAELFGDAWDKYRFAVAAKFPEGEIYYDVAYELFKESDFYSEEEKHPGVFSVWLDDVLGYRSHHMIYHLQPKRRKADNFQI